MEYLGHRITKDGLATLEGRVRGDVQAPTPSNVAQVKSVLGMLTFCLRYLPQLTTIFQSLQQQLKKRRVFRRGSNQERESNETKELLRKAPFLTDYDVHKPLLLTCDVSSYDVGVLAHQIKDDEHAIDFHSRTMAPTERNYSQIEKEALAMICDVRKFHKYPWGSTF